MNWNIITTETEEKLNDDELTNDDDSIIEKHYDDFYNLVKEYNILQNNYINLEYQNKRLKFLNLILCNISGISISFLLLYKFSIKKSIE